MKVILKPVSHPQIGEISIDDELFAIGRNEEPFASGLGEAAARLSRRHARIFEEDGKVYIADLGSLNGTRINEQPLKNGAAVLQNNDLITFGNEVSFRVELQRDFPKTLLKQPLVRLTLVPVDPDSGLESIAVERFPFLIARIDSAFEQYKERFPEALRQLSRRHAVITVKADQVYIEDLESFNGTFVGGQRLDERARQLSDGDTVMFGTQHFAYRAHLDTPHEATQFEGTMLAGPQKTVAVAAPAPRSGGSPPVKADSIPAKADSIPAAGESAPPPGVSIPPPAMVSSPTGVRESPTGNRTRFVSSADSFINVFCADNHEPEADGAPRGKNIEETAKVPALKTPTGPLQKLRTSIGEFWKALSGGSGVSRKAVWIGIVLVAVIAGAIGGSYLVGLDRREIKTLLDDGKYAESANVANSYLRRHPDDHEANNWADEALTKAVLPTWIGYIDRGRFDEAAHYLRRQGETWRNIPHSGQMTNTLVWAGNVLAHMSARGGPTAPIRLFRDEDQIAALVAEWDGDSFRRQQIMDQMVTRQPEFEHIHSQVFSTIRTLRSDNATYVKAMTDLKSNVAKALKKDDRAAIDKLIDEFATDFPRIEGLDALRQDLSDYDDFVRLAQKKNLLELVRQSQATKFQTPIFADHVDGWLAKSLPPADVIAGHTKAAAAWHEGNHDEAIEVLKQLTKGPWGEVATRQIARYEKIESDYADLLASRNTPAYWDQLLALWGSLRPNEDEHIIRILEPDFRAHRDELVPRLDETLRRVRDNWTEYQNAGGIPGMVRVEDRVSPRFAGQAKRLSSAYQDIASGARTYQLLQVTPSDEWLQLQDQVVNEVERQRRWLEDLSIVLAPALLRAKLNLLPEPPEQSLWVRSTTDQNKD
jgi:pSer/pThr/pTyr-binding forkhead associated (FHA) protein